MTNKNNGLRIDEILDFFADKEVIGGPVLIGDVLEKMDISEDSLNFFTRDSKQHDKFLYLWSRLGFKKSLNEIFSGEVVGCCQCQIHNKDCPDTNKFKDPDTQAFYKFLDELVPKK